VLASESKKDRSDRDLGHRNHFQKLIEEGVSWSGKEPNVLFQNRGDGTFDEVGNVLGLALRLDSRGAATGDLDGDGDLDLVVYSRNNPTVSIYRNDAPVQGNVLMIDLVGAGKATDAIGAQVIVNAGGKRQLRQVEVGSGFLSQSASTLHFGLGAARQVESVEVRWLSGARQTFGELPVDSIVTLREGQDVPEVRELESRNYNRGAGLAASRAGISSAAPELVLTRFGADGQFSLAEHASETIVLNFWATWCVACIAEMPDLVAVHEEMRSDGVAFVGVTMDDAGMDAAISRALERAGVEYPQAWGTLEALAPFASLADAPPGSLPVTAVVHQGVVRWAHLGKIDVGELRDVLKELTAGE